MQLSRSSSHLGAILSLLGGALIIYGAFLLPMAFGHGGGSFSLPSEWDVGTFFFQDFGQFGVVAVLLILPLLSVLFVLGTSAASFFRELSPGMVIWRRITALAGLIIQGLVGYVAAVIYSFNTNVGPGYWLVLLGFIVMSVGTFLNRSLQIHAEGRKRT